MLVYGVGSLKRARLSPSLIATANTLRCAHDTEVFRIREPAANDEIIVCKLAGCEVELLIDSGASINAITVYDKLLSESITNRVFNVQNDSSKSLTAYATKIPLKIMATLETDLWIDEERPHGVELFYVIQGARRSLLGRETSIRYNVLQIGRNVSIAPNIDTQDIKECHNINSVSSAVENKVERFPSFDLPPVKLNIDKSIAPHRSTYSSIPPGWREATNRRIEEMLASDIIERVTSEMDTSHCSALLAVAKGKDDFRLVVDLRGPNKCIIREPHKMPTLDSISAKHRELSGFQPSIYPTLSFTSNCMKSRDM